MISIHLLTSIVIILMNCDVWVKFCVVVVYVGCIASQWWRIGVSIIYRVAGRDLTCPLWRNLRVWVYTFLNQHVSVLRMLCRCCVEYYGRVACARDYSIAIGCSCISCGWLAC